MFRTLLWLSLFLFRCLEGFAGSAAVELTWLGAGAFFDRHVDSPRGRRCVFIVKPRFKNGVCDRRRDSWEMEKTNFEKLMKP